MPGAKKKMMGMQPGDIYKTFADIDNIKDQFGFNPKVDIKSGLTKFNKWYKEYYNCQELSILYFEKKN